VRSLCSVGGGKTEVEVGMRGVGGGMRLKWGRYARCG